MHNIIWLDKPAADWLQAFPLGNGNLGAMLFGGITDERLALNHENLWRGVSRDKTTVPVSQYLPEIRQRFFTGEWQRAVDLLVDHIGKPNVRPIEPYQTAGDLLLHMPGHDGAKNYRRSLDLATGIAEVTYQSAGITYHREVFISAVHSVLVLRITADTPAAISTKIGLSRVGDPACERHPWAAVDRLGYTGVFTEGITFAEEVRVHAVGGHIGVLNETMLDVQGADELLLVMAIAVDYNQPDPARWCAEHLDTVPKDFTVLSSAHVAEHRALFDRVALDLFDNSTQESLPVDQRLARVRAGKADPSLAALYFQYGRYLLMASSRNCDQPANLQGIWSEGLTPPWSSDFHLNINLQMNYWAAEAGNLAECAQPLIDFLHRLVPQGQKAARDLFNCRGIFFGHATDIWAAATLEHEIYSMWACAAPWLAEHLWWRYEYSQDMAFLRDSAYPFMKEAATFFEDFLVRDAQGRLVTVPSQSPENCFVGGSAPVSLCIAATMDLVFIHELLTRCLQASELLQCDEELRTKWQAILSELPPFQIGRHGQLQEWLEDYDEVEPGHRHASHLAGVFPGEVMTPTSLPEFYEAARVALVRRLAAGGGHTGWSRAWTAAFWARFMDGEKAYEHLMCLLTDFATDSLLDLHPAPNHSVFQIDGNFGGTAAVLEMLLQSHGGVIRLLPALPPQWPNGEVRGLRARGAFTIDISWHAGCIYEARITSEAGFPCRLAWPGETWSATSEGKHLAVQQDDKGYLLFATQAGQTITIQAL